MPEASSRAPSAGMTRIRFVGLTLTRLSAPARAPRQDARIIGSRPPRVNEVTDVDSAIRELVAREIKAYVFSIGQEGCMSEQRHVRLFRNGRNQAVRIPVEFELPGDEAIMHRDGDRLVIEPVRKRGLVALLQSMQPLDEDFPEIDDPVPAPESAL